MAYGKDVPEPMLRIIVSEVLNMLYVFGAYSPPHWKRPSSFPRISSRLISASCQLPSVSERRALRTVPSTRISSADAWNEDIMIDC